MTKQVRVSALWIRNVSTGPDPGNELEFYGVLEAERQTIVNGEFQVVERKRVFTQRASSLIELSEGSYHHIDQPGELLTIQLGEFLGLTGGLVEDDTFGSGGMTPEEKRFPHDSIMSGDQIVRFEENGQILDATFRVEVL